MLRRLPWLWLLFTQRVRLPLWLLSAGLFAVVYLAGILCAFAAGSVGAYVSDVRWYLIWTLLPLSAFVVGYVPVALDRQLEAIRPWLASPDAEVDALRRDAPVYLARAYWWVFGVFALLLLPAFLLDPQQIPWLQDFPHPNVMRVFQVVIMACLLVEASAASIAVFGLGAFTYRIQKKLDLKRGFIQGPGKALFRPFSRLLLVVWACAVFPLPLIIGTLAYMNNPNMTVTTIVSLQQDGGLVASLVIFVLGIIVPHLLMNRLLAKEKAEELEALRAELETAATPPEDKTPLAYLGRIQRHQHLVHQLQTVEKFTPSLMDIAFMLEVGMSVGATLLEKSVVSRFF